MALKKSEPYSSLWSSCDELRGGMDASQGDYAYLLHIIRSLKSSGKGAVLGAVPLLKIRALRFPVPTLSEQVAFADVLSHIDAEIATLEARLAKARLIKQGMMQNLLTGRIRLV